MANWNAVIMKVFKYTDYLNKKRFEISKNHNEKKEIHKWEKLVLNYLEATSRDSYNWDDEKNAKIFSGYIFYT